VSAAERIFVGLGANQGDTDAALTSALHALDTLPTTHVAARSSFYVSAPVDADGPDYLNAVAELRSELEPAALLAALQAVEGAHGRTRPFANAPRPLDLDLLLYGERVLATPALTLPHPRAHLRAFVLEPLADIDSSLCLPGLGPIAPWRIAAASQALRRAK
jgi:2-amino-4-hydroxy-6-hydroxymethyldihydropteridine diphosphokinase